MDFDDLDDAEETLGPKLVDLREQKRAELQLSKAPHPAPKGKGFGGGTKRTQKLLYLHGPGSNNAMSEKQVQAVFKNLKWVVDFHLLEWHYLEGTINHKLEEIHWDPAVQKTFAPFGRPCGESFDGYMSYVTILNESHQKESWIGPKTSNQGYEYVMDDIAKNLAANGPYDGLCGFDIGASLAFEAARLAQEGDPRFTEKFRYLLLFSCRGHREMAEHGQGTLRPKSPLQIPCFLSWSEEDDSKQFSNYEDLALYIHPRFRRICLHSQGHRPPNFQKNTKECEVLDNFIGEMQAGSYHPGEDEDVSSAIYKGFWLPLPRQQGPELQDGPVKLIVIPDPLGQHGPLPDAAEKERQRFPAQEPAEVCAKRLDVFRQISGCKCDDFQVEDVHVIGVNFDPAQSRLPWHPVVQERDNSMAYAVGSGRSRWLQAEDEVQLPWQSLEDLAVKLLEETEIAPGDNIALLGLGTGAHVAFGMALALIEHRNVLPVKLLCVCPPSVWPAGSPGQGSLITTPICYLTCPDSVAGPPWRWETATFGAFGHRHFQDKASLVATVQEEMKLS